MSEDGGSAVVIVYTLYGERHVAEAAASAMVTAHLAACANILSPCHSYYLWNGLLERQEEFPVLFKTTAAQSEALMVRIGETHPYDVPAILRWEADAAPDFARWIGEMAGGA